MSKPTTAATAIALSFLAVLLSGLALFYSADRINDKNPESENFEQQARQYLLENPEILVEAMERLKDRRQQVNATEMQALIAERRDDIFNDPAAPTAGNPNGDVDLVEFFDYNCPYCRKASPSIKQATSDDSDLQVVFKEMPILGPGSEFAARAALASRKQGKYENFHHALMGFSGRINEGSTMAIAEDVGLDIAQLKQDMEDPAIADAIDRNRKLARDLRITGTPAFVVGDEVIRGLVDLATLQRSIAGAREKSGG